MNRKFSWIIGAFVVMLLAVGVFGTTTAYADDGGPGRPFGDRGERGFRGGELSDEALATMAEALDMSTDDLSAALEEGTTLKELADSAGVDLREILGANRPDRAEGMRERGFGGGDLDDASLETMSELLGLSADDLSAALEDGKTIHELADAAGVEMQTITDAMSVIREEAMREHIAQALEDGTMTQEQADWMLEGLEDGSFSKRGGFGGHGGF